MLGFLSRLAKAIEIDTDITGIASIIGLDMDNQTIVQKHLCEDFNTGSQLIVHESQEAVFYVNGHMLDSFGPGRHTLETQNLPLIGEFFNTPTGGYTPFHCEVYFVNKIEQKITWGTDSKVGFQDPVYGHPVRVGASGEMFVKIGNARKFLTEVVGTKYGMTAYEFGEWVKAYLMTQFASIFISYIRNMNINILNIDECKSPLSSTLHENFRSYFASTGVNLTQFYVSSFAPEKDKYYEAAKNAAAGNVFVKQQQALESVKDVNAVSETDRKLYGIRAEADGSKYTNEQLGITEQEKMHYGVLNTWAGNEGNRQGVNQISDFMTNVAIGGSLTQALSTMTNKAMSNPKPPPDLSISCVHCKSTISVDASYCLKCGKPVIAETEIICSKCSVKVLKGRYCSNCSEQLTAVCPSCNKVIPFECKFCLHCRHKI